MKKLFAMILSVLLLCGSVTPAFAAEDVPAGFTPIRTAEDLNNIRNNLSGKYILMNDIDLSGFENWSAIGTKDNPFTGTLKGENHAIKNLKTTTIGDNEFAGLFGYIQNAALSGLAVDGKISITSEKATAGGVCGFAAESQLDCCRNTVDINVTSTGTSPQHLLGGIVGFAQKSELTACANLGVIRLKIDNETTGNYENCVSGGICGLLSGNMSDCRNAGKIEIQAKNQLIHLGGLVGRFNGGTIKTSYNFGKLAASAAAEPPLVECHALIGSYEVFDLETSRSSANDHVSNCYYLDATGWDGFGTPLTHKEFGRLDSFVGFDFKNIWKLPENAVMPLLRYESELPTIIEKTLTVKTGQTIEIETDGVLIIAAISDNPEIASVSGTRITGNRQGTATIRVTLEDGTELHYAVTVRFSLIGWLWRMIHSILDSLFQG